LYVTKYDDPRTGHPTVDGSYTNNITSAAGGIYKVYGNSTTYPTQPNGPLNKKSAGFAAVYPNALASHHYVQLSVTEFSEFWLHGTSNATPLPVEMLYLEAEAIKNEKIQLRWATAVEVNNSGFQVERTTDGQTWVPIGWVDGNNNTTSETQYEYNDVNVAPNVRYYYRLKQVDFDGQFEYTDVVTAMIIGETTISVKDFIPNPTTDRTNLLITSTSNREISVEMYNLVGQKVSSGTYQLHVGANNIEFDTHKLSGGTYTAIITANEVFTKKIVIAR